MSGVVAVTGKVVHYDTNRGFGFLAPESGGADVFLHINDIDIDEDSLKPGAKVSFDIEETCLLYTSPSPRDLSTSRMPSSA